MFLNNSINLSNNLLKTQILTMLSQTLSVCKINAEEMLKGQNKLKGNEKNQQSTCVLGGQLEIVPVNEQKEQLVQ